MPGDPVSKLSKGSNTQEISVDANTTWPVEMKGAMGFPWERLC